MGLVPGRGCCVGGKRRACLGWRRGWRVVSLTRRDEDSRAGRRCLTFWLRFSKGVAFKENFLWEEEKKRCGNDPNPLLRKRVRPDRIDLGLYLGVLGIAWALGKHQEPEDEDNLWAEDAGWSQGE